MDKKSNFQDLSNDFFGKIENNDNSRFYGTIVAIIVSLIFMLCIIVLTFIYFFNKSKCCYSNSNDKQTRAKFDLNKKSVSRSFGMTKSMPIIVNLPSLANSSITTVTTLPEQSQIDTIYKDKSPIDVNLTIDFRQQQIKSPQDKKNKSKSFKLSEYRTSDMAGKISAYTMSPPITNDYE